MQVKSSANLEIVNRPDNQGVGRTLNRPRPAQGALLADLRGTAGLSQAELARLIGVSSANIGFWELSDKPPRSEVLPKLAAVLGVSVEDLIAGRKPARRGGPVGKVRKLFEDVSKLPRKQQEKVVEFVSAFVAQTRSNGAHAR